MNALIVISFLFKSVTFKANIIPKLLDEMAIHFLTNNEEIQRKVASFIYEWENDLDFFETETSGSTGIPKKIRLKKKHAIASSRLTGKFLNLQKGEKAFLCLHPSTIGGKMMIIRSLVLDLDLIVGDISSNPFENISESIDFVALVPMQLQTIINGSPFVLKNITNIIVGGGVISNALENELKKNQLTVYQTFGMTETISHIALKKVGFQSEDDFNLLPGVEIETVDHRLKIHFPAIGVEHLLTNDLVEITSPNRFKWMGRTDFVINSGGIKIHPEQIEKELEALFSIPFFVTGLKDEVLGEKLVIVVEGSTNPLFEQKNYYSTLEKFKIPKEIYYLNQFETTSSGKINRLETLKNIHAAGFRKIL